MCGQVAKDICGSRTDHAPPAIIARLSLLLGSITKLLRPICNHLNQIAKYVHIPQDTWIIAGRMSPSAFNDPAARPLLSGFCQGDSNVHPKQQGSYAFDRAMKK